MLPSKSSTYATLKSSTLPPKQFLSGQTAFFFNVGTELNWAQYIIYRFYDLLAIVLRVTKINVVLDYVYISISTCTHKHKPCVHVYT